ncbi:MAG: HD domain-containing protein [Syntrophomonadaceae bacterium]|nr:HD domain-containing protein [Syntrophomonadaceae bacterium]
MENKGPFQVKELKAMTPGRQIFGKFLLLDKLHRKTKDNKDMYNIKLGDVTGNIDAVVWENCPIAGDFAAGAVIGLLGDIGSFNGKIQVTAKRIKVLDEDPAPYLPGPAASLEALQKRFEQYMQAIKDVHLNALLTRIFTPALKDKFYKATAAKSIHHNYGGGLLEHTLEVADLCSQTLGIFPELNRDLVLTGALLHDVGKIVELDITVVPQYTIEGRLVGHIVLGTEMIANQIGAMRQEGIAFPDKLEWMLKHMILSHHGSLEFGSPVIPLFPEALLLHAMDNLDAKMFIFFNKINESGGENEFFTNYDSFFAQHFFKYRYLSPDQAED